MVSTLIIAFLALDKRESIKSVLKEKLDQLKDDYKNIIELLESVV